MIRNTTPAPLAPRTAQAPALRLSHTRTAPLAPHTLATVRQSLALALAPVVDHDGAALEGLARAQDARLVARQAAPVALSDVGPSNDPATLSDEHAGAHEGGMGRHTLSMTLTPWRGAAEAAQALNVARADDRLRATLADYAAVEAEAAQRQAEAPRFSKPRPPLMVGDAPSRKRSLIRLADEFLAAHHAPELLVPLPTLGTGTNGAGRRWGARVMAAQGKAGAAHARALTKAYLANVSAAQRLAQVADDRRDAAVARVNRHRNAERLARLAETGAALGIVVRPEDDAAQALALILASPALSTLPKRRQGELKAQALKLAEARTAPVGILVERTSRTMTAQALDNAAQAQRLVALAQAGALAPCAPPVVGPIPRPCGPGFKVEHDKVVIPVAIARSAASLAREAQAEAEALARRQAAQAEADYAEAEESDATHLGALLALAEAETAQGAPPDTLTALLAWHDGAYAARRAHVARLRAHTRTQGNAG